MSPLISGEFRRYGDKLRHVVLPHANKTTHKTMRADRTAHFILILLHFLYNFFKCFTTYLSTQTALVYFPALVVLFQLRCICRNMTLMTAALSSSKHLLFITLLLNYALTLLCFATMFFNVVICENTSLDFVIINKDLTHSKKIMC